MAKMKTRQQAMALMNATWEDNYKADPCTLTVTRLNLEMNALHDWHTSASQSCKAMLK